MPDITCCTGRNDHCENSDDNAGVQGICPQRDNCYRYTATPNPYRQSYFVVAPFHPLYDIDGEEIRKHCDYFVDNKNA